MRAWVLGLSLTACGRIDFDAGDLATSSCTQPWSAATVFDVGVTRPRGPSISSDDLDLYLSDVGGDLWISHRTSPAQPFPQATLLPSPPNSTYDDAQPAIGRDGLDLYWYSGRQGGAFWMQSHRASPAAPWPAEVDTGARGDGDVSADGLLAYLQDYMGPIVVYARATRTDPFTKIGPLGPPVEDGSSNHSPALSSDGRELYFMSDRDGSTHIWVARRASASADFTEVARVAIPEAIDDPAISGDGHHLYFIYDDGSTTHLAVSGRCL